jgi:hypothetical protein
MRTSSKWCQTSSSICTETPKPSWNISICAFHPLTMLTCLIYNTILRLTGSLALSIAYGIQADTPENEFFRMYKELLDAMTEASVPGAFLVDILPFRGSNRLSMVRGRALTDGDLPQSNTYPPGSQVCDSTRLQKKLSRTCTRPKLARLNISRSNSRLRYSEPFSFLRTPTDFCVQSGGKIYTSMASVCLEDLEALGKKGVDMEVIYNTVGIVYAGRSCFIITHHTPYRLP